MLSHTPHVIYLVSDGTCRTGEQIIQAVLVQFDQVDVEIVRKPHVRKVKMVNGIIKDAAQDQALVLYTLVSEETRQAIEQAARQYLVPTVDLLGPILVSLYDLFKSTPAAKPGILYHSNKAQFDRIDAVDFTLHHDDGCRELELHEADVVLVGISRTSKSTTCFYLAYSGVRAANVPLFPDHLPPEPLLKINPRRVIGLTMNPQRMRAIREARLVNWKMPLEDDYADEVHVARELRAAHEQMVKCGWRIIDVSYKAIEEIAREVLLLLKESNLKIRSEIG